MKHFILGLPGQAPDLLHDTDNHPNYANHKVVHEFIADPHEAGSYFKGYVARWKEAPDVFGDVAAFHQLSGLPHPANLTLTPGADVIYLREKLITEEVNDELLPHLIQLRHLESADIDAEALRQEHMIGIADGIIDSIYVLSGSAVSFGLPWAKVWNEVQRSNMAKVAGGIKRRGDGKILKPAGWTPPNIAKALGFE
jgi:predicted HAD superfamily Cof-like phosphohydrolase